VERPSDMKIIGRWGFKVKRNSNNEPEKFKVRLVSKGYNQKYGVDYFETFASVVKVQILRTLPAMTANLELLGCEENNLVFSRTFFCII